MKVIIAGGREFSDYNLLCEKCDKILSTQTEIEIVSGKAKGADSLGEQYAKEKGYNIKYFPADWDQYGKSAGYIRNKEMSLYADALICFWDGASKGSKHMIDLATEHKLKVKVIKYKKPVIYKPPIFSRVWSMPSRFTFDIKPINLLIHRYFKDEYISIDPFANKNRIAKITNDLDPDMGTDHCMDALDFLKQFEDNSIDFILYDPPYSTRQVSECYKKMGRTVNMETTQSSFWGNLKKEIARVSKPDTIVISFGWNSNGIGKTLGFEILEILIVAHGGIHNDTICTVERKL